MLTLVLGGARSGKSQFAESLIASRAAAVPSATTVPSVTADPVSAVSYVATARTYVTPDPDFEERVRLHRERRPDSWETVDEEDLVNYLPHASRFSLVDDLGTWLTHKFDVGGWEDAPQQAIDELLAALRALPSDTTVVIVSPEVGLSIIPEHRSARLFRDTLGLLNAQVAQLCDDVYFVAAGLPIQLKPAKPIA